MRGRKPLPTGAKIIRGTFRKSRENENEPRPALARPMPPEFLDDRAKVEWGRVVDELYNLGLMSKLDVGVLAAYCDSYAQFWDAKEAFEEFRKGRPNKGLITVTAVGRDGKGGGNLVQNPLVGIMNKAKADMVRYGTELGLTPSARSRIDAEAAGRAQAQDPAERFFA